MEKKKHSKMIRRGIDLFNNQISGWLSKSKTIISCIEPWNLKYVIIVFQNAVLCIWKKIKSNHIHPVSNNWRLYSVILLRLFINTFAPCSRLMFVCYVAMMVLYEIPLHFFIQQLNSIPVQQKFIEAEILRWKTTHFFLVLSRNII